MKKIDDQKSIEDYPIWEPQILRNEPDLSKGCITRITNVVYCENLRRKDPSLEREYVTDGHALWLYNNLNGSERNFGKGSKKVLKRYLVLRGLID